MNKFQLSTLVVGLANALLMLLLPPYDRLSIAGSVPRFDAYYLVLQPPPGLSVNTGLLVTQLIAVAVGVLVTMVLLRGAPGDPDHPAIQPQKVVFGVAAALFVLIMLFPPFETIPANRLGAPTFNGFSLAFGGGLQRGIFVPMLFLEILLLAANTGLMWLFFGIIERRPSRFDAPAAPQTDAEVRAPDQIGRSVRDRRQRQDPNYKGPERRRGPRRER